MIKKYFSKAAEYVALRVFDYGHQYTATVIFFFFYYIVNPVRWDFDGQYNVTTLLVLRVLSLVLWFGLALWKFWPKKLSKYLPLYYLSVLFYNLVFRTSFVIFYTAYLPSYASFGVLGFMAFAVLVDNLLYIWLSLAGMVLGAVVFYLGGGLGLVLVSPANLTEACYMFLTISFIKLVLFRNHNIRLESKVRSYKTLAGAIAHEVGGPLNVINLECQKLINQNTQLEQKDIIVMQKMSTKVIRIIASILLQLKFMEGKQRILCERINLNKSVNRSYMDPIFSDLDRQTISIEIDPALEVLADEELLSQVFINFLRNSLRAIRNVPGGKITISAYTCADKTVSIIIYDNGVGISEKQQKKLFMPFYSQSPNGVGLGLAFSKLVLHSMGWSIACESEKGKFTRFYLGSPED
jgi:signal transduction histidine kinase